VREAIVARDLSPTVHEWRKRQTEVIAAWNRLSHQLDRFVESVLPPDPPKTKQF